MRQQRTGKGVDRRLVSFVFVFVFRSLLQDEPKLPPDEEGLDARALGGPVLGVGGAQEEQGRTLQVCLSSSPNAPGALDIVVAVPVPQIQEQIVDVIKVVDVETNHATDCGCAFFKDPGGNRGACRLQASGDSTGGRAFSGTTDPGEDC